MKKKRLFYLDFVRVVAMFLIVSYHFAMRFSSNNDTLTFIKIFANPIIGTIGVTLFFMISGASLMYNYGEKMELKEYYKKRFLGIYPMFWIAYSIVFLYDFYCFKGFFFDLPIYKLGFSLLGMDGYFNTYTETWYLIGEWFLGAIVLIYLVFPLLRWMMKKSPKVLFAVSSILYVLVLFVFQFKMPVSKNFVVCMYQFLVGMYFVEYGGNAKWWQAVVSAFVFLILTNIKVPKENVSLLIGNGMGFSLFMVLAYLAEKINLAKGKNILIVLGKYSYPVFLIHHQVIWNLGNHFFGTQFDKYGILCAYIMAWFLILIMARILYKWNKKVVELITVK